MDRSHDVAGPRVPRRASSIREWNAPWRNHDWVAARLTLG